MSSPIVRRFAIGGALWTVAAACSAGADDPQPSAGATASHSAVANAAQARRAVPSVARRSPSRDLRLPARVRQTSDGRYVRDVCDRTDPVHCFSDVLLAEDWEPEQPLRTGHRFGPEGVGTPFGMAPADVVAAYDIPSTTKANGAIVAIVDSPDSSALADLQAYRQNYYPGDTFTQCSSGHGGVGQTPCFSQVNETGSTSSGTDSGTADGETSLDMDMISAACPDCSILLVEMSSTLSTDIQTATETAISLGAVAVSISFGAPEFGVVSGFTTPGHLVVAASGDFGYDLVNIGGDGPSWPSSSTDVLAVGGTNLVRESGAVGSGTYDEAVWDDGLFVSPQDGGQDVTTSGCSAYFALPWWQSAAVGNACGSGTSAHRATVDLAAAATYTDRTDGYGRIGISTYCSAYQGIFGVSWIQSEGTSASSPLVAALLTRVGLSAPIANFMSGLGGIDIYSSTGMSAFNDLGSTAYPADVDGSSTDAPNACTPAIMCNVEPGWDGPSGVGTPNAGLLAALPGVVPTNGTGSRGRHGGPI